MKVRLGDVLHECRRRGIRFASDRNAVAKREKEAREIWNELKGISHRTYVLLQSFKTKELENSGPVKASEYGIKNALKKMNEAFSEMGQTIASLSKIEIE